MYKKKKIIGLLIILALTGCTGAKSQNKGNIQKNNHEIIEFPTYTKGGRTLSYIDNEPVTGLVVNYNEYSLYRDGILINRKEVDTRDRFRIEEERNYNNVGLRHGKSIHYGETTDMHNHGVLEMELEEYYSNYPYFKDGVAHGWKYYEGLPSATHVKHTFGEVEDINWNIKPGRNFSGRIHSRPKRSELELLPEVDENVALQIGEYEKGELVALSLYSDYGHKMNHYEFYTSKEARRLGGDSGKVNLSKYIVYDRGVTKLVKHYDINAKRTDENIIYTTRKSYNKVNFVKGLPHGDVTRSYIKDDKMLSENKGSYNMGMFSGIKGRRYYLDGMEVEKQEYLENHSEVKEIVLHSEKEAGKIDNFTGYILLEDDDEMTIFEYYEEGNKIARAEYTRGLSEEKDEDEENSEEKSGVVFYSRDGYDRSLIEGRLQTTKYNNEDGSYTVSVYDGRGMVIELNTYDKDGVLNGPYIDSAEIGRDSHMTKGEYVDGYKSGPMLYYDDKGEIVAEAMFPGDGGVYTVTSYYDYESGEISWIQPRNPKETSGWFAIGTYKSYYRNGNLRRINEYGDEKTMDKDVHITRFNEDGSIEAEYIKPFGDSFD